MKKFKIKFRFRDKGIVTQVEAENAAMAKQKVLSEIYFVSVDEVKGEAAPIMDFLNGFGK